MFKRCRRKPLEVLYHQISENIGWRDKYRMLGCRIRSDGAGIDIETSEGWVKGRWGNYLMVGTAGELYPVTKEIFEQTFDILEEDNDKT